VETVKVIVGVVIIIASIALIMYLLEQLAKKIDARIIWFVLLFLLPFSIGLAIVVSNYDSLVWYEILFYPFLGSVCILAAALLVAVMFNPELLCLPIKWVINLIKPE
jgi:hypothetical protein